MSKIETAQEKETKRARAMVIDINNMLKESDKAAKKDSCWDEDFDYENDWKKPVIAYMKPGSFSYTGSYIVIRSYDMKYFMINDPNSSANSNIKWKHNDLTNKIEKCWAYYK